MADKIVCPKCGAETQSYVTIEQLTEFCCPNCNAIFQNGKFTGYAEKPRSS